MDRRKKENKVLNIICRVISIVQTVFTVLLIAMLFWSKLLPALYMGVICGVLVALLLLFSWMMRKKARDKSRVTGMVLSILVSVVVGAVCPYLYSAVDMLQSTMDATEETTRMSVYVLADDPAQSIEDARDYTFGRMESLIQVDTDKTIEMINEELQAAIQTASYERTTELADALLNQECGAIILNESFVNLITDAQGYENFDTQIREIATYEWKTQVRNRTDRDSAEGEEEKQNPEGVFTLFISGIDTSGDISTRSRSDVNIIAVVNTNTRQILLVSTPRDYYVPLSISNGERDKLTHAGIYGVDVSMDTLGMLYDIDMDYYFRVNFSGFQELIDALGGVSVVSDYTFDAGEYHFVQGTNELDGKAALAFARERHAFAEGDRQRGKNQMAVIRGVISKLQSPAILQNFTEVMSGLEGSFESDMPYDVLSALVRNQLEDGGSWNVSSYSVDGSGDSASTYSMSQPAYVMIPDQTTVDQAKEMIREVMSGE